MDNYMNWLGIFGVALGLLIIRNKIAHMREMKKMQDDINKKLEYHKRPPAASFSKNFK